MKNKLIFSLLLLCLCINQKIYTELKKQESENMDPLDKKYLEEYNKNPIDLSQLNKETQNNSLTPKDFSFTKDIDNEINDFTKFSNKTMRNINNFQMKNSSQEDIKQNIKNNITEKVINKENKSIIVKERSGLKQEEIFVIKNTVNSLLGNFQEGIAEKIDDVSSSLNELNNRVEKTSNELKTQLDEAKNNIVDKTVFDNNKKIDNFYNYLKVSKNLNEIFTKFKEQNNEFYKKIEKIEKDDKIDKKSNKNNESAKANFVVKSKLENILQMLLLKKKRNNKSLIIEKNKKQMIYQLEQENKRLKEKIKKKKNFNNHRFKEKDHKYFIQILK